VASKNYLGDSALVEIDIDGMILTAKLAGDAAVPVGARTGIELPVHRWHLFP
jgi:hypothetical protein